MMIAAFALQFLLAAEANPTHCTAEDQTRFDEWQRANFEDATQPTSKKVKAMLTSFTGLLYAVRDDGISCPELQLKWRQKLIEAATVIAKSSPKLSAADAALKKSINDDLIEALGSVYANSLQHLAVDRVTLDEKKWTSIVNDFGARYENDRKVTVVYRFSDVPSFCFAIAGYQIESFETRYRDDPKWVRLFTKGDWHSPAGEIVSCN